MLQVGLPEPLVLEVSPGMVTLVSPALPQLAHLRGPEAARPPWALLRALSCAGVHLLPEDRDAALMGREVKAAALEVAMCHDVALLW
jgi:hypothetical protein